MGSGCSILTERFPGEPKEGLASGGLDCSEIGDIGEGDADRIPTLDVTGLLARMGISEGEEDGIASGKRSSTRHRKDCVVDSTSLDLRYPSFASGVTVHLKLRIMNSG